MSTKIYNAYEYKKDIHQLFTDLKYIREEYLEYVRKLLTAGKKTWGDKLRDEVMRQMSLQFPSLMDDYAFQCDNVVIYLEQERIFFQTFGELDGLKRQGVLRRLADWLEGVRVRDYHYQNQADPWYCFEDLSKKELREAEKDYEEREKIWDSIFEGNRTPSMAGLSFNFATQQEVMGLIYQIIVEENNKKKERTDG